ncbi:MAG: prolipoprotein diacylglyceryl transferase [Bacteroidota bacterium]|nr:prolipoprotein diacylglyceryl transferase [Bacteroidota bacterium]
MLNHLLIICWNPIYWNPSPDFIEIGNFSIKWYGIMWGLSLFAGFFVARYVFRKLNRDEENITIAIQYMFICALIGARLAHVLFYALDYYMAHPLEVLEVWKGGLASHGGTVGAIFGLYLFCKRNKEFSFFWTVDHGVIAVFFLASFIRLGNLINSEILGQPTNVPWAFVFVQVDNVPRHPVVLYESIAYLLYQLLMLYLFNKYLETKPGIYLTVFFFVFAVRFFIEFFKVPDGDLIFGAISKTQLLNVPFIIAGFVMLYLVVKGKLSYPKVANG